MLCHMLLELLFGLSYIEVRTAYTTPLNLCLGIFSFGVKQSLSEFVLGFEVHWNVKIGDDPAKFL